ncbi:hypothetical protein HK101_006392 [Irineochytrium annulatum]|nr:hypothetical protein HK101_006392 [Irineochytrium annulatum]
MTDAALPSPLNASTTTQTSADPMPTTLSKYWALKKYQLEVSSGLYMLEPFERMIIYSFMMGVAFLLVLSIGLQATQYYPLLNNKMTRVAADGAVTVVTAAVNGAAAGVANDGGLNQSHPSLRSSVAHEL